MKSAIQDYPKALTRLHNLYCAEKNIYCRGQRNSDEEKWTQVEFKNQNNIRKFFEHRVKNMESKSTQIKLYFTELLYKCRKQNTPDTHLILGFLYQHGYGIRRIISRAIEFYTLAAKEGTPDAQYNLGSIYHAHHEMKWNYREAFKWYTKAAENKSSYAQNGLAGVDIDYEKTIYWYPRAAEMRNVKSQISLGCIFRKGIIVDRDDTKAIEWYKAAQLEGNHVAQNCLDLLGINRSTSKKGLSSKLRDDVAVITEPFELKEMQKSASNAMKKDGNAMLKIGLKYYHGNNFKQDTDTAFRWMIKAAKAELIEAQILVAEKYKNGDCIE
jgi:TPR repeat protein